MEIPNKFKPLIDGNEGKYLVTEYEIPNNLPKGPDLSVIDFYDVIDRNEMSLVATLTDPKTTEYDSIDLNEINPTDVRFSKWLPEVEVAVKESIKHWERMIKWVEDVPMVKETFGTMYGEIREDWSGQYCPLCKIFWWKSNCIDCPLDEGCGDAKCCAAWQKVNVTANWEDWLKTAKEQMMPRLEVALKDVRKEVYG